MDEFHRNYELIWSAFALGGGILLLLFRDRFIKGNARIFERLHVKTGLSLFKQQARSMDGLQMRAVAIVVAILLIISGIQELLEHW